MQISAVREKHFRKDVIREDSFPRRWCGVSNRSSKSLNWKRMLFLSCFPACQVI